MFLVSDLDCCCFCCVSVVAQPKPVAPVDAFGDEFVVFLYCFCIVFVLFFFVSGLLLDFFLFLEILLFCFSIVVLRPQYFCGCWGVHSSCQQGMMMHTHTSL